MAATTVFSSFQPVAHYYLNFCTTLAIMFAIVISSSYIAVEGM